MRLTVVGCSGSHPGPDAACSAYLVEHDGFRLLLDLGNGALGPLQRYVDPRDLDAIYLSHLHGDHWLDLVPLAHLRRQHPLGPPPPVPVMAPAELGDRIAGASGSPASSFDDVFRFEPPRTGTIGPFEVALQRTAHPVQTHAIRLTAGGASVVYTADTAPFDELPVFAAGADLLLAEAGFADGLPHPPGVHLTGADAGALAASAGVGRLVVTHIAPWNDPAVAFEAASRLFDGDMALARPGDHYQL